MALTDADVREMLIQHILTEEIFSKVFDDSDFHQHNNVARELYALEGAFFTGALKRQTLKGLESYYAAIRSAAAQIASHSEKQTFLKVIYENFYKVYNAKAADRLGVVYTPNEIVRFMMGGTDWLCEKYFKNNLMPTFVTNRSFIESRTFDGFWKTVAQEFADIYVVDLGGDVRANPRLSGTKHNVFGIQTGVAISVMVKRVSGSKDKKPARVHYLRRPELETAEEKLGFLANHPMRGLDFDEVQPNKTGNWVNLTNNDFETLLPLASKETKAAKTNRDVKAIFRKFSLGVVTARDEWVYDFDPAQVENKVRFLIDEYNAERQRLTGNLRNLKGLGDRLEYRIKWSRAVKNDLSNSVEYQYD